METSRRNSSLSSITAVNKTTEIKKQILAGACTFVKFVYGENQQILLNSYSSCRRLLDHLKPVIGVQQDEMIDLIDNEGKMKDLNSHSDEYASQFLTARNTYYVLKIEIDSTGDKRYTPFFNIDQIDLKMAPGLANGVNSLNKTKVKTNPRSFKQNSSAQSTSNITGGKKRTSAKK